MRAISHVVGKAIRSSRRAGRGAGCWLRTTMAPPAGADIEAAPIGWRAGLAARRPLAGRACPDGRHGGGGSAGPRSGRSRDVRFRAPVCARFRPRLRSSARARTARSCVVPGRREPGASKAPAYQRSSGPLRRGAFRAAARIRPRRKRRRRDPRSGRQVWTGCCVVPTLAVGVGRARPRVLRARTRRSACASASGCVSTTPA
jgi:hypothetical protein